MPSHVQQIVLAAIIASLHAPYASAEEDQGTEKSGGELSSEAEIPDTKYQRDGSFGLYLEARGTYLTGVEGVGYEYGAGGSIGFVYFLSDTLSLTHRYGVNRHDSAKKSIDWQLKTTRIEIALRHYNDSIELGPVFVEIAPGWNTTKLDIENAPTIPDTNASGASLGVGGGMEFDFSEVVRAGFVARYTYAKAKDLDERYKNKNRINGPSVDIGLFLTAMTF